MKTILKQLFFLCVFVFFITAQCSANNSSDLEQAEKAYKQKDFQTAYKIFLKLANEGEAYSQYKMGCFYSWGRGVKKDPIEAVKWYQKSANQ